MSSIYGPIVDVTVVVVVVVVAVVVVVVAIVVVVVIVVVIVVVVVVAAFASPAARCVRLFWPVIALNLATPATAVFRFQV